MLPPIRCFTCGKIVGNKYEPYKTEKLRGILTTEQILDQLGLVRECCRLCISQHVDLIDRRLRHDALEQQRDATPNPAHESKTNDRPLRFQASH